MNRAPVRWLIAFLAVAVVAVFAWRYWVEDQPVPDQSVISPPTSLATGGVVETPAVAGEVLEDATVLDRIALDDDDAEAILRRGCSWPVHPDTWRDLDERCLAAMDRVTGETALELRLLVGDAAATRRAVVAALDDRECRVPPLGPRDPDVPWNRWQRWQGEPRPDLRGRCAADAMVRLAELQIECVPIIVYDTERDYWGYRARFEEEAAVASLSQEEYYRLVRRDKLNHAYDFWRSFLCRSAGDALAWVDALPEPLGDPDDIRYHRPPYTQALDLYDTARRLGADVPEWAEPSAFEDHDFNPPAQEELPEGVYETGPWVSPVRF